MQILAIATAIAVVCALHPIPNQGARHCGDLFSVALANPAHFGAGPEDMHHRLSPNSLQDSRALVIPNTNLCVALVAATYNTRAASLRACISASDSA